MTTANNITFAELAERLAEKVQELCTELLPGGKQLGHEWVCGSVNGEPGKSLHVELRGEKAGKWHDHATGEGGDLLKMISVSKGIEVKAAADWARTFLGLPAWTPDPDAPPPFDPLKFTFKQRYPERAWTYRDASGAIIGYVCRFELDGKKDIIPLRIIDGKPKWKGWTGEEKKPIYNLDQLTRRAEAPVLIVEGEKTADAARKLFPGHVCITWQSGSKAVKNVDWSPLIARSTEVVLWPDADAPGRAAMRYLKTLLPDANLVNTSMLPDGWDLADPALDGVDLQAMMDAARYCTVLNIQPTDVNERRSDMRLGPEYILPKGVDAAAVTQDILDYGIFFHGNRIWAPRTKQTRAREEDQSSTEYHYKEVSNFTIRILQHMRDLKVSMRLVEVENVRKALHVFEIPSDKFASLMEFKKAVEAYGNYHFNGNATDFERLKAKLMNEMGTGRMINVLGWNPGPGVFVFNNAAVNGTVIPFDENGVFTKDDVRYYVPSGNSIYADNDDRYEPQKRVELVQNGINFRQWAAQVHRVHGAPSMVGISHAIACLFSDHIFKHRGFFPMLYFYGPASSGKSQMVQALQHLFGRPQQPYTITGKANTDKARIRKFAQFRNMLVFLEEFRNTVPMDMIELLKGLWNRYGYERGTIDSAYGTESVPINSGVAITGNDYPQEDSFLSRLLVVMMMRTDFGSDDRRQYDVLNEMMAKGYSGIVVELLAFRKDFELEYGTHYEHCYRDLNDQLGLEPGMEKRMIDNPACLLAVFRFFEKRLNWPFTYQNVLIYMVKTMKEQNAKRDTGGDVAHFWDCFRSAVKDEKLVLGEQFRVDGNDLIIAWSSCHSAYMMMHQQLYRTPGHSKTSMSDKLQKSPAFSKVRDRDVRINSARVYGLQFKVDQLGDLVEEITAERPSRRKYGHHHQPANGVASHEPVGATQISIDDDDIKPF